MSRTVEFDNSTPENLKVAPVSDRAFRLWFDAACWCARERTNTLPPAALCIPRLAHRAKPRVIAELLAAGLFEQDAQGFRVVHLRPTRQVSPHKRVTIPWWLRNLVIERDGVTCQLCGQTIEGADLHIDHVLPVSRGGRNNVGNLQVTHARCNMSKGARVSPGTFNGQNPHT